MEGRKLRVVMCGNLDVTLSCKSREIDVAYHAKPHHAKETDERRLYIIHARLSYIVCSDIIIPVCVEIFL